MSRRGADGNRDGDAEAINQRAMGDLADPDSPDETLEDDPLRIGHHSLRSSGVSDGDEFGASLLAGGSLATVSLLALLTHGNPLPGTAAGSVPDTHGKPLPGTTAASFPATHGTPLPGTTVAASTDARGTPLLAAAGLGTAMVGGTSLSLPGR